MIGRLPESISVRVDPSTRRSAGDATVLGGSPLRLVRFTPKAAAAGRALFAGEPVGDDPVRQAVARRLLDHGMVHPRDLPDPPLTIAVVVPVRDHAAELDRLLAALPAGSGDVVEMVVVDDGSADPEAVRRAVGDRARLVRNERSAGPGAARNRGAAATSADVVAFVDADVVPPPGWLARLRPHFADPAVGLVAPRVRSRPGPSLRERYERARSPLDLGPEEARVLAGSRVSYVPSATLLVRRRVFDELGGFAPAHRVGEDVDLVWRAVDAGWTVRYEPGAEVEHDPRPTWTAMARQRIAYGSAAAQLDAEHPWAAAPAACNVWTLVAWGLAVAGGRRGVVAGLATTAVTSGQLARRLRGRVDRPVADAVHLAGRGTLVSGLWLGRAVWRAWLPVALVAAVVSRRARVAVALAAIVPALVDHRAVAPTVDPVRWTLLSAADDTAYCAGVWRGARRRRSLRCLLPRLTGIPGA